jgi:hypothetical protein
VAQTRGTFFLCRFWQLQDSGFDTRISVKKSPFGREHFNVKGVFKMENKSKVSKIPTIGLAVIIAVIGFTFAACGDGTGDPPPPPEVANYPLINLTATKWGGADGSAEQWTTGTQIKLSDFTTVKPKKDDVLTFKISGTASEQINNCRIAIFQMQGDNWDTYKWVGESEIDILPNPFEDCIIVCIIWDDPVPNGVFYVEVINTLWQKGASGEYTHNSGQTLPPETENGDVMATISNFSISLVVDSPDPPGPGSAYPDPIAEELAPFGLTLEQFNQIKSATGGFSLWSTINDSEFYMSWNNRSIEDFNDVVDTVTNLLGPFSESESEYEENETSIVMKKDQYNISISYSPLYLYSQIILQIEVIDM